MVNYDRVFISRTTILVAITLGLAWVVPHLGAMLVINLMLYLTVIMMGPVSAGMIGLLTPWFCYRRAFIMPALSSIVPYMIVGNLAMVIVFYLVFSSRLPAWLRYPLAIGLSALSRYMVIHIPAVTFIHMPPTIGVQLLQLLIAVVSGVLAILISSRLRQWGIQDFHTLKLKRAISQ